MKFIYLAGLLLMTGGTAFPSTLAFASEPTTSRACPEEWSAYVKIVAANLPPDHATPVVFTDLDLRAAACSGGDVSIAEMRTLAAMSKSIYDLDARVPKEESGLTTQIICVVSYSTLGDRNFYAVLLPGRLSEEGSESCKSSLERSVKHAPRAKWFRPSGTTNR